MKQLLITIAAVVLVGCGGETDYSGNYWLEDNNGRISTLDLKKTARFIGQEMIAEKPIMVAG